MKPADIFLYLAGHRGAIERIAASRRPWIVGAILVLTAGIARNYDHLDLLRQPEWIYGPFAASLVSTGFIFLWIQKPLRLREAGPLRRQLLVFLTLFWLTAPCAWLYAVRVEAMTDSLTAAKWNIAFLAIVATWRVAIVVRAVTVLTEVKWTRALVLVLTPATVEVFLASAMSGLSLGLVYEMGGLRVPPDTKFLLDASRFTTTATFLLLPVLLVATFFSKGTATIPMVRPSKKFPRSTRVVVVLSLVVWAGLAILFHPPLANRFHLKRLIARADYRGAADFASGKSRREFPPDLDLKNGPFSVFPLELLDALPSDGSGWLREEGLRANVESFETAFFIDRREWLEWEASYPEVTGPISRRAAEFRRRSGSLNREERMWLNWYDNLMEQSFPSP